MPPVEYICINHVDICWAYFTIQLNLLQFNSIQCSVFSSPQFSHIFGSNIFCPVFPNRICKSTASGPFCDRSPVKLEINFELLISKYINIKSFFCGSDPLSRESLNGRISALFVYLFSDKIKSILNFFDEQPQFFSLLF